MYSPGTSEVSIYDYEFSNRVRAAYVASLESQITSLREELASIYKTQGQNAQRLLSMNEALREKEELIRFNEARMLQVSRIFSSTVCPHLTWSDALSRSP